jgi:hypothetical protein
MARVSPTEAGTRLSLRRVRDDGEQGDLVGFVLASDGDRVVLCDRRGAVVDVPWSSVLAWRPVGVARGRDPMRTPLADLDRLAEAALVAGRAFVTRLSDLLLDQPPAPLEDWAAPPPSPARLDGEWVTAGPAPDYLALGWWAAHHDARSLQIRTDDPDAAAELARLGFRERARTVLP